MVSRNRTSAAKIKAVISPQWHQTYGLVRSVVRETMKRQMGVCFSSAPLQRFIVLLTWLCRDQALLGKKDLA